jgi:uncharacterized membrane protein YfcA
MPGRTVARLAIIAIVTGAFSGLFGVGGGGIMVPLMVLWLGFEEREATGTSLAAIAIIAGVAVLVQGIGYGKVDVPKGLLIGIPAVLGVVAGTALQQRVPTRAIAGLFAVVLVASAVSLVS